MSILNNTIYKIRTGHGISTRTYQINALRQILGTGQESYASPSIWVAVLGPTLLLIATHYFCFEVTSPSVRNIFRIGDAYVEDTFLMKTSDSPVSNNMHVAELTEVIEELAQNFKRNIFSTSISLNLRKCFWHLIS